MEKNLDEIFDELKLLLSEYTPPFKVKEKSEALAHKKSYELISLKEVVFGHRKRRGIYFASVIKQKDFVGFYFMPVYVDEKLEKKIGKKLLSTLHGKTCFRITSTKKPIKEQIKKALDLGKKYYIKKDWI